MVPKNEDIDNAIIGRTFFEAIGSDNRKILASACDKNEDVIYVPEALKERLKDKPSNMIASSNLYEQHGIYHSDAGERMKTFQKEKCTLR